MRRRRGNGGGGLQTAGNLGVSGAVTFGRGALSASSLIQAFGVPRKATFAEKRSRAAILPLFLKNGICTRTALHAA